MQHEIRLRYLYEAARLGTMRAAGKQLDVATSSVSRQIAALEKELDVPLIEGGRRRIKLTEAGEAACVYYRESRAHEEAFLSRLEELKSIRTGRIDLAVGEAFITEHFSQTLQQFMRSYPGMTVRVKVSGTNDAVAMVRDDEAHFGIIFDVPRDPKVRARLSLEQPLKVVMHPSHELAQRESVNLSELTRCSIGLPEDSLRIRQLVRAAEATDGVVLESDLIANSMILLRDFAKCGRGVTVMPEFLAQDDLAAGKLKAIATTNAVLNSTKISLITRAGRQMPIGVSQLLQQVERYLRNSAPQAA